MNPSSAEDGRATFIAHKTRLIAEDLKDILLAEGFVNVMIVGSPGDIPLEAVRMVVVDGTMPDLYRTTWLADLAALDVPVLVLDGSGELPGDARRIERLAIPFRSDQVVAALRRVTYADCACPSSPGADRV